jgi:hypothetical protein
MQRPKEENKHYDLQMHGAKKKKEKSRKHIGEN